MKTINAASGISKEQFASELRYLPFDYKERKIISKGRDLKQTIFSVPGENVVCIQHENRKFGKCHCGFIVVQERGQAVLADWSPFFR